MLKELYFSEILNMFKTLILVLYSLHNQRCLGTTVVKFDYKVEECSFFMPSFLSVRPYGIDSRRVEMVFSWNFLRLKVLSVLAV